MLILGLPTNFVSNIFNSKNNSAIYTYYHKFTYVFKKNIRYHFLLLTNVIFLVKFSKKLRHKISMQKDTRFSVWTDTEIQTERHEDACSHFQNIANASNNIKRLRKRTPG
jgi:hypothetical protein